MRARLAMAVDPLLGRQLATMLPSPTYDGAYVDLWIRPLRDGRVQVDAVVPRREYRQLFKVAFDDPAEAIDYWREQYKGLFGIDPLE